MVNLAEFEVLQALGMHHFPADMPEWARELTLAVCKSYRMDIPEVKWAMKNRRWSSGRAYSFEEKRIHRFNYDVSVVAGTEELDIRLVLLHELAHFSNPVGEHHGYGFWNRAFDLYELFGIPVMYAHNRERKYRAMAEEVGWARVYAVYGNRR